jgi:hypothetical protein
MSSDEKPEVNNDTVAFETQKVNHEWLGIPNPPPEPDLRGGDVLLYVEGETNRPISISGAETVTFGRSLTQLTGKNQFIDMEDYGGVDKGVSRQHAMLHVTAAGVFVEDLKSTNGTRVNEKNIQPLKRRMLASGDTITFGQCRVTIYFANDVFMPIQTIQLVPLKANAGQTAQLVHGLTHLDLAGEITPLVAALFNMQTLADTRQTSGPATIISIFTKMDGAGGVRSQMEMTGIEEAVQLIVQHIQPFRLLHQDEIRKIVSKRNPSLPLDRFVDKLLSADAPNPLVKTLTEKVVEKITAVKGINPNDDLSRYTAVILFSRYSIEMPS